MIRTMFVALALLAFQYPQPAPMPSCPGCIQPLPVPGLPAPPPLCPGCPK